MQPLEFFAGVDWSSKEHQVCVLDLEGKICGQRGFAHCGKGLHEMIDWIVNTTGAPTEKDILPFVNSCCGLLNPHL